MLLFLDFTGLSCKTILLIVVVLAIIFNTNILYGSPNARTGGRGGVGSGAAALCASPTSAAIGGMEEVELTEERERG